MAVRHRWKPAKIKDRAGEDFATVNATVWRLSNQSLPQGQRYDFSGCCDAEARDHLVGKQNMILEFVEGDTYRVQDAIYWPTLGYVELHLIQVSNEA